MPKRVGCLAASAKIVDLAQVASSQPWLGMQAPASSVEQTYAWRRTRLLNREGGHTKHQTIASDIIISIQPTFISGSQWAPSAPLTPSRLPAGVRARTINPRPCRPLARAGHSIMLAKTPSGRGPRAALPRPRRACHRAVELTPPCP